MAEITITVHAKTGCPYCDKAKEWLADRQIPFVAELHDDDAERQALYDRLGLAGAARTVPQVMVTDEDGTYRLGGYQTLITSGLETLYHGG